MYSYALYTPGDILMQKNINGVHYWYDETSDQYFTYDPSQMLPEVISEAQKPNPPFDWTIPIMILLATFFLWDEL